MVQMTGLLVLDGNLTKDEAVTQLAKAATMATLAMPDQLAKASKQGDRDKIIQDRDMCVLAYLNARALSLVKTGPAFEKIAKDLDVEADKIAQEVKSLQSAGEAVALLSDLVRLSSGLALAFA